MNFTDIKSENIIIEQSRRIPVTQSEDHSLHKSVLKCMVGPFTSVLQDLTTFSVESEEKHKSDVKYINKLVFNVKSSATVLKYPSCINFVKLRIC